MTGAKFKNSLIGGLFLGLSLMLLLTSPALATETHWSGLEGDWINPGEWTNGVPANGIINQDAHDVFIDNPGAYGYYPSADDSLHNSGNPTLNSLLLDPSNPLEGKVSLEQIQDTLTVKNTTIGKNGTAAYFLDTGTNKILQDLTLGTTENGDGSYFINQGSLSVGGNETLGLAGQGFIFQFPLSSSIALGESPSLGCTPHVTPPHHFTPPHHVTPPHVTPPPVSSPHSVGKNLYLGVEHLGLGEFDLSNSSLDVGGSIRVGIKGKGIFNQTDSTVKIKGNDTTPLTSEGILSSGPVFSAISKSSLKNNPLGCVSSRQPGLIVGLENVHSKNENINNYYGQYNLSGGTLNVNYSEIIGLDEGGDGIFTQSNGTHTINGNLYLGMNSGSSGVFDLSVNPHPTQDTPTPSSVGLLDVYGFASVGYLGDGVFSQDGGTVKIRGIDQEVNLRGKSLSTALSKRTSLSCNQPQQYIGFTVGRGGTGTYYLDDGELQVSRGEIIGMLSGSNGTFSQFGGNHFIGGNLTIARDPGSIGTFTLGDPNSDPKAVTSSGGTLKVQGSLLNNVGGTFDYYDGELQASVINKGKFNAYGPGTRTFPSQFFNYGTFLIQGKPLGTAAFAQKFQNYGIYQSIEANSEFTSLYVAPKGYLVAGSADNYYVKKEFTNNSTQKTDWVTDTANLIFTGPGRKPFKTGSAYKVVDGFVDNFAWDSLGIDGNASVQLLGHLYVGQLRGVQFNAQTHKITNLFGYCGGQIYFHSADTELNGKILTDIYGRQVGSFTDTSYVPRSCR